MKLRRDCKHCDTNIEFTKEDITENALWKKGETFIKTEEEIDGKKKRFHKVEYIIIEDFKGKSIECPVCNKQVFLDKDDMDGWWMQEYAGLKAVKSRTIETTEWYKTYNI